MVIQAKDLAATYEIYRACGLYPPKVWARASIAIEIIGSVGLVFAIYTRYVAAFLPLFTLVAAWACWRVSNGKWIWNFGDSEYPLFWAICCVVVAMHG